MGTPRKKIFSYVKLISDRQSAYGIILNSSPNTGLTLLELMITLVLMGILLLLAFSMMSGFIAWSRLNIATFQLSQQWKTTRYNATGQGEQPTSVCMAELLQEQIQYTQIQGGNCALATQWFFLPQGVSIDQNNSTLLMVNGIYYRASWADTRGGLGGSWGQLGRIVLISPRISAKKCLFLYRVDGSWNIRENGRCNR
jgi:prepilin-type N-terminal cleavage/methylation domain-containing protein